MKWVLAALALVVACPAAARDLPVPPDKGWQHAESGMIVMPRLAGLSRTALTDATATERDVTVQFDTPDKSVFATIYIFHPAIADAALWFDRARATLEAHDTFRHAAPATADPIAFIVGAAPSAAALRQVYSIAGGPYRSTAVAVVPFEGWIVSIRITAKTLRADELDARLLQMVTAIRWPKAAVTAAPAVAPITKCTTPLVFTKARTVKPNGSDLLVSLMGPGLAAKQTTASAAPEPRRIWCREGDARNEYGVYRSADLQSPGYVMALYDAGRIVRVEPGLIAQLEKTGTFGVTLQDVDDTVSAFSSFASLPDPKQVWKLIAGGETAGRAAGNQITLDPKGL